MRQFFSALAWLIFAYLVIFISVMDHSAKIFCELIDDACVTKYIFVRQALVNGIGCYLFG